MSFDELATPLFGALYNYARWLTRDPYEAEDLVQETYVKALRGFGSFAAGTNFRAWMYRILRNTFLTSKSGLKENIPIDEELAAEGTPETLFMSRVDADALRRAIESLPLIFRGLVAVRHGGDVLPRDRGDAGHSGGHGHVAPDAGAEKSA